MLKHSLETRHEFMMKFSRHILPALHWKTHNRIKQNETELVMPLFSAEAMVEATMSTGISGLLLLVRNCHASVKMATEPTLSL